MGNTLFTSICRREEIVDFEDISDATFDFISVAMDPASCSLSTKKTNTTRKTSSPRLPTFEQPMPKIVAVVPMAIEESFSTRPMMGHPATPTNEDTPLSFNDRLNMLTWDPETTPLPTPYKHHEFYVFDEYAPRPSNTSSPSSTTTSKRSRGWIGRAVEKYNETKTRRRESKQQQQQSRKQRGRATTHTNDDHAKRVPTTTTKTTKKRSLPFWRTRQQADTTTTKDTPYQLPLMASMRSLIDDDDECQRFLFDDKTTSASEDDDHVLLKTKTMGSESSDDEPVSDTESDDSSASDATTLCAFYTRFDEHAACSSSSLDGYDDSDDEFSEWTRSSSTSSCYYSAAEGGARDDEGEEASFCSSSSSSCDAMHRTINDYLCECGDCPAYTAIEREVTNSNCWMNETERRGLCRVLQAFATYQPTAVFQKEMISSAEECLLVFQGDEQAAFHAFVRLAQTKW